MVLLWEGTMRINVVSYDATAKTAILTPILFADDSF